MLNSFLTRIAVACLLIGTNATAAFASDQPRLLSELLFRSLPPGNVRIEGPDLATIATDISWAEGLEQLKNHPRATLTETRVPRSKEGTFLDKGYSDYTSCSRKQVSGFTTTSVNCKGFPTLTFGSQSLKLSYAPASRIINYVIHQMIPNREAIGFNGVAYRASHSPRTGKITFLTGFGEQARVALTCDTTSDICQ